MVGTRSWIHTFTIYNFCCCSNGNEICRVSEMEGGTAQTKYRKTKWNVKACRRVLIDCWRKIHQLPHHPCAPIALRAAVMRWRMAVEFSRVHFVQVPHGYTHYTLYTCTVCSIYLNLYVPGPTNADISSLPTDRKFETFCNSILQ